MSEVSGGHHAVEFAVNMLERHDLIDAAMPTLIQVQYLQIITKIFSLKCIVAGRNDVQFSFYKQTTF